MKYSKDTTSYIQSVIDYLKEKYGDVKPEWMAVIMLLADNLQLYKECLKSIKENGIYDTTTGKKNPLLTTTKDLQATIMKQVQHLGLSPYSISKIKLADEEDTDEYIEDLTNG